MSFDPFRILCIRINLILVTEMICPEECVDGICIPTNTSDPCGAGKRTCSRPCVDGTFEKCSDSCRNKTEECIAGENQPECEITTVTTTPSGMFDSFQQISLLIACTYTDMIIKITILHNMSV